MSVRFTFGKGTKKASHRQCLQASFILTFLLNALMFLEIPCQVPCRGMLQSDLGLRRKGMACIMHFVFQFMILESNTSLLKAAG